MKLFVWCNPYNVPYGSSMVIVVAETEEEARAEAANDFQFRYGNLGPGKRTDWSGIKLGAPDRIVDCPVAEWREWSE